MARKMKIEQHRTTAGDASSHVDVLQSELGDEMRSWYDNMSENLQGGDKGSQVDEAANTLEGLDSPDCPEFFDDLEVVYSTMHKGGRKGDPRWLRRDNETSALSSIVDTVRERIETIKGWIEEVEAESEEELEDDTEISREEQTYTLGELRTAVEEGETFADELESVKDEADGVEFPGMYG